MCDHSTNETTSNENDNRKWVDLDEKEKINLYETYAGHGKYFTNKSRTLSDLLFNWLLILNSGGLVSVITLFTSQCAKNNIVILSKYMGLCFILGIIFIYAATKLSKLQSDLKGKALDNNLVLLNDNKITVGEYTKRIYADEFPSDTFITLIEIFSLFAFIIGLILGFNILK